ncbi:kinesin light chain [Periconia macrospinosa]|uniref:Kinesin light chain n=1 Tax=Periconia macrospinosa TaxID=97972 RepID=A0A2V1DAK0_9PLEO|nr:kinesin light chain [Periconia macrospinosa]
MPRQLPRNEYTVGWVCALPVEFAAAQEMLDEEHADLQHEPGDNDENMYALGSIGGHNVAIGCLPAGYIGTNSAAAVAMQMRATFKRIRFSLMVGIGGGVPSTEADVRLGDVVVSQPDKTFNGVVQYDSGKTTPSGFGRTGALNAPPRTLLGAVAKVRANELRSRSKVSEHIAKLDRIPKFQRSKAGPDVLFEAAYDHERGQTCDGCLESRQESRPPRDSEEEVVVHYGTIASGNQVMKSAAQRDKVSEDLGGVLCFEMEAAGLMNSFPCLVVRGICDYADSHKNKRWQPYAAGVAAAYAREVLSVIPPADVAKTRTAEDAMQTASRRAIYSIPFLKNRSFVGRKAELDMLKQKLMVDRTCRKMSIVGLGGTGKTQVALQFAYAVKKAWPEFSIFWMPAVSMESFEQACGDIVTALHIRQTADDDVKELVKRHLSTARAGKWLLVVDNADDRDVVIGSRQTKGVVDYLPQSEEGVVLFTTRVRELAVSLTRGDVLKLGPMDRPDAVHFLEASLANDVVRNEATTNELLDELAYLPLAIVQAAAYLNINEMSVARYLQLLRSTEQSLVDLMSREFRDETRYEGSANAVATTWVVSFSQIRTRDAVAAELLLFLSCIEWKAIPRSILPAAKSEVRMDEAINTLCGYSFLTKRGEEDWYDMHRLVHLATRVWVMQQNNAREVTQKGIRHIAGIFPSDDYANQAVWRAYLPHTLRILEERRGSDIAELSKLCLLVGRCLQVDGRIREAVKWLEESCQQREALDKNDSDRLLSQHELARAYEANGQVKEAVKLLEGVVAIEAEVKEAVKLLEGVVAIEAEVLAEDYPDRLMSQQELAGAYQVDGQIRKAVGLLKHVVVIRATVLAEDHPHRLMSQHNLAGAYLDNGQVKEALELLEGVVAIRTEVLAEDHPDRLASQHELARAYRANGQIKEAVKLLERVAAIEAEVLAEDHPNRLASQQVLAQAYQADGRTKEAVKLLEGIVAIRAKVLAEDHPSRLASQHALAIVYQANGQIKEAVKLLEGVVAIEAEVLAEDHPSRLASQHALAMAREASK